MNRHEQYRRELLTDPSLMHSERTEHLDTCAKCRAYTANVVRFEEVLARALNVPVTTGAGRLPFTRRTQAISRSHRWFALAASVLLSVCVGSGFWLAAPSSALAAEVIAHMAGEPNAWDAQARVPDPDLSSVLKNANMRLDPGAPAVRYSRSCPFRGHIAPHLVIQTPHGPVTVMVLIHERVARSTEFNESGYRGTIIPIPNHGSLAILMRAPDATIEAVDAIANQVRKAIVWGSQENIASVNGADLQ